MMRRLTAWLHRSCASSAAVTAGGSGETGRLLHPSLCTAELPVGSVTLTCDLMVLPLDVPEADELLFAHDVHHHKADGVELFWSTC